MINSVLGTLVSDQAPAAIDRAFRLYMLPQGIFSVAIATVLFPTHVAGWRRGATADGLRRASGAGVRQIALTLIPAAVFMAVLATPLTRLVYQRGEFGTESTELVSTALFWFAFSLPFAGANLLLTRTFFSLQRPWIPTRLAVLSLVVNTAVSLALYKPFGIAGIVIGTAVASAVMTLLQAQGLRVLLRRLRGRPHAADVGGDPDRLGAARARLLRRLVRAGLGARPLARRAADLGRLRAGGRDGGLRGGRAGPAGARRRTRSSRSCGLAHDARPS